MQTNLAVCILSYVLKAHINDDGGVALSVFRLKYNIPASTFYRHVNTLIQARIIARISRDSYVMHHSFITGVAVHYYRNKANGYLEDNQTHMFEVNDYE
jgi:DNA-binding IclR family transcriptional regulator